MSAIHVLTVEDEAVSAMVIQQALQKFGYEVSHATSGEEALEKFAARRPDLILMDINLAGELDGIQTAAKIKETANLPLVYLTANSDDSTFDRARSTTPLGYLIKPFEAKELRTTIEIALSRHQMEQKMDSRGADVASVLKTMGDGVIVADNNRKISYINPVAEILTGWKLEEAIGKDITDVFQLVNTSSAPLTADAVNKTLSDGVVVEMANETVLVSRDGKKTSVSDKISPIHSDEGSVKGVVLVFKSVSAGASPEKSAPGATPARKGSGYVAGETDFKLRKESAFAADPNLEEDPTTGLPTRVVMLREVNAAIERGERRFLVSVVLERYNLMKTRFGLAAANEVLVFYGVHLGQVLTGNDRLYQGTANSFVAMIEGDSTLEDVRRQMSRLTSQRLERLLRTNSRTVLLALSVSWDVFEFSSATGVEDSLAKLDAFVKIQLARS